MVLIIHRMWIRVSLIPNSKFLEMISRFRGHVKYEFQTWLDSVKRQHFIAHGPYRCCGALQWVLQYACSLLLFRFYCESKVNNDVIQRNLTNNTFVPPDFRSCSGGKQFVLLSCTSCMCMKKGNAECLCCFVLIKIENGGDWAMCLCLRVDMCAFVSEIQVCV